jgi:tetratricopeptide (TPR) repeat protein
MPESLEDRVATLEKKQSGRFRFFFQYLAAPILLAVFGSVLTYLVGREQRALEHIEVAQTMLPALFSPDKHQPLATKRLLDAVIDDMSLRESLDQIVTEYFSTKLDTALERNDLATAKNIYDAASAIGGSSGEQIAQALEGNPEAREKLTKYEEARHLELVGYEAVADNQFDVALSRFKKAEAIYPTLHSVREIRQLLEANPEIAKDPASQAEVKNQIATEYSWKVPEETLSRLHSR